MDYKKGIAIKEKVSFRNKKGSFLNSVLKIISKFNISKIYFDKIIIMS